VLVENCNAAEALPAELTDLTTRFLVFHSMPPEILRERSGLGRPGFNHVGVPDGIIFPLLYFYFWKLSLHCGNNSGVLRLSRTPPQGVSRVSGVRDRIFSGTL
jgi:hypothetical protein